MFKIVHDFYIARTIRILRNDVEINFSVGWYTNSVKNILNESYRFEIIFPIIGIFWCIIIEIIFGKIQAVYHNL